MPRSEAKIFLQVEWSKVQYLHDITEEDAKAEGCSGIPVSEMSLFPAEEAAMSRRVQFANLWNSINKEIPFSSNPVVHAVQFNRVYGL